jgi:two-component system, chemotaxis family, protein-glutamate methylesterase/glutaminase
VVTEPGAVVVVGASAGGVEALRAFAAGLPPGLPAAICVVLHIPSSGSSVLAHIIDRSGPLSAVPAINGMDLAAGRIHVAPADFHLLVEDSHLRLAAGPAENGHRPAVDPLFRSAAKYWHHRAIGLILSGNRDDGAAGLAAVARRGGTALVQDPAEALYPSMPTHALARVPQARSFPAAKLGAAVAEAVLALGGRADTPVEPDPALDAQVAMAAMAPLTADQMGAVPAGFGCPDCHGALFEVPGEPGTLRCRIGHAWSLESLLDAQGASVEAALWVALRNLEEKVALTTRLASAADGRGHPRMAERYSAVGSEADEAGRVIRNLIERVAERNALAGGLPGGAA